MRDREQAIINRLCKSINDDAHGSRYFAGARAWYRHDKYLIDKSYRVIYAGKKDSYEWYNPFDRYPEILIDWISLASYLMRSDTQEDRSALAELLSAPPTDSDPDPDPWPFAEETKHRLNLDAGRILDFCSHYGNIGEPGISMLTFVDFMSYTETKNTKITDEFHPTMTTGTFLPRWYARAARTMELLGTWKEFWAGNFSIDDETKPGSGKTWRRHLTRIYATSVDLAVTYDSVAAAWKIDYRFKSLSSALDIMLALSVTSDNQQIKFCKLCRRPFLAKNRRAIYCSGSCSNVDKVRRHRAKQSAQKTVVKSVVELPTKQGKTRGKRGKA